MAFITKRVTPGSLTKVYSSEVVPVGTVVADEDGNEYIFGAGVASCLTGSWVSFDEATQATLLAANAKGRVGVAMAAIVASSYGYFQIYGKCLVAKALADCADNADLYATATAGSVDDAVVAGDRVKGAIGRSLETTTLTIVAELNRPIVDDIAD